MSWRPHVSLKKTDAPKVSLKKPGSGRYVASSETSGTFYVDGGLVTVGGELEFGDAYLSFVNDVSSNVVFSCEQVALIQADTALIGQFFGVNATWSQEVQAGANLSLSLFNSTSINSGELNLAINNTWEYRFSNDYTVAGGNHLSYRTLLKQDFDSVLNSNSSVVELKKDSNLNKGNLAYLKESIDYNHLHDNTEGSGWVYRYYNQFGTQDKKGAVWENLYRGYLQESEIFLRFFGSSEGFQMVGNDYYTGTDTVIPWPVFSKDVKEKASLIKEKVEIAAPKIDQIYERVPADLVLRLNSIAGASSTAAGSAGMASSYSQQNNAILQGLDTKITKMQADIDLLKADVAAIKGWDLPDKFVSLDSMIEELIGEVSLCKTYAGTAAQNSGEASLNAGVCIDEVRLVKADVSSVKTTVGDIDSNVSSLILNVGDVKQRVISVKQDTSAIKTDVSVVKSGVKGIGDKIEECETKIKQYVAWVVQCISTVFAKLFIPFSRCFDTTSVKNVSAGESYSDIVDGVPYGVVDVENLKFSCPNIVNWWPYWPVFEDSQIEGNCRFVSEDMSTCLSFYYYPR